MKVGDLIRVEWKENNFYSTGVIVEEPVTRETNSFGDGFYMILCDGEHRAMHSDFIEVICENR